ncbi:MAG: uroporphyrinogen decarboxylase family protein [Saccharofermentanales bacterium]
MIREPLSRVAVIKAIERSGGSKIPLFSHKWWGMDLEEKIGPGLNIMAENYPDDIFSAWYREPGYEESSSNNKSYRLGYKEDYSGIEKHSIGGAVVLLPDWSELDLFLEDFPDPDEPGNFDDVEEQLIYADGRYKLGCWWRLFHERFWSIRGMENLMMDYYDNMDGLKIIGKKILEFDKVIVDKYKALGFDGIFTSDDLGHQTGPMMSPDIFKELYLPLYKEFVSYVHSKGMHVFLHSCGDNTKLMDYLVEAGIDVFHPVQKGCMNEPEIARKYGDRISFLAGVDVQHLLPEGTVEEVRAGVQELIDTYYKPEGGLLLAAGNGILPDTPFENIEEMLKVMASYK